MSESTGKIVFINSHDYVSADGVAYVGCLATMRSLDDNEVSLLTDSLRLQHTLEMAYATGRKVTVDYFETAVTLSAHQPLIAKGAHLADSSDGPFTLKAIWTRE